MTGRWKVRTRSSTHVWVLDVGRGTYARYPDSPSGAMPHDGTDHPITSVGAWPRVGGHSLVVYDDPVDPLLQHWRRSATILNITQFVS